MKMKSCCREREREREKRERATARAIGSAARLVTVLNCRQIQIWDVQKGVVLLCGVYNSVQEAAGGSPRQELKSLLLHQGLNKKMKSSCRERER